ncbi:MAG: hypothetical protein JST16_14295 [Bdellovibrionales bacterium]|nr:hypothetical protein [Bdellovibrionales bacterium]
MRGRRNEHFGTYAGVSNGNERGEFKGELAYCELWKRFTVNSQTGSTFITKHHYKNSSFRGANDGNPN